FFQAEDGIRDRTVTGVQTCALPIFKSPPSKKRKGPYSSNRTMLLALSDVSIGFWVASLQSGFSDRARSGAAEASMNRCFAARQRSEERRVGKERRSRGSPDPSKNDR